MSLALVRGVVRSVSGLLMVALLSAVGPNAPATADGKDRPTPAAAQAALARVQNLAQGPRFARRPGVTPEDRHALTPALRDLAATKEALQGEDRRTAEQILARPTGTESSSPTFEPKYGGRDPKRRCSVSVCVHFVTSGQHRATPEYADKVLAAATRSHRVATQRLGYRAPLRDPGTKAFGGNPKPDIYLGDLPDWLFGYAAPEGYYPAGGDRAQVGYVVLDTDYDDQCRAVGYTRCDGAMRSALMRVTAAHEYFHLIQFGYDYLEDTWFMEATATWIEDEIFDGVNDNVGYLRSGPSALRTPSVPIDAPRAVPYANWIWFRHLTEQFGSRLVTGAWRRADTWRGADGTRNPANLYSVLATRRAVVASGGAWNGSFADFAADNRRTTRNYSEGGFYPNAPLASRAALGLDRRRAVREFRLSRLASATHRVRPQADLRRGWRLRVIVEGNPAGRGGLAVATIRRKSGSFGRVTLPLGSNGRVVRTLPFGRAKVRWVEITIVNASTRYQCDLGNPDQTCRGRSLDNSRPQKLVVRAVR